MDPNATVDIICSTDHYPDERADARRDLLDWISRGGYMPTWENVERMRATHPKWTNRHFPVGRVMLPRYSSVGGYPLFYVENGYRALCYACATHVGLTPNDGHANWEDHDLCCDECSMDIEAAYGEPDDD